MACLALYLGSLILLNAWGSRSDLRRVDCIVVLGARVGPDHKLGPSMQARLDRAVELWRQGWSADLLTTGGRGASGLVESRECREAAAALGVPREHVECEDMSHDTWENLYFARDIMRRRNWRTCLIVTDPFHLPRSLAMARDLGLEAYPAPTFQGPSWRRPGSAWYYSTRELMAILKYQAERLGR